jgi:hypothetical protein
MSVSFRRLCLAVASLAIAGVILWEPVSSAQKTASKSVEPSAGKGTIYIGTYPNQFWIIDEASAKVVGSIPFKSGIPRRTSLSRDRTRFYTIEAQMEKVEIIDIASRKTIDQFTLSEPNKHVRIRSLEPDPKHRFLILVTKTATKLSDRWEVGATTILQYDLASHSITRTIPWPNNDERENANIQFSPDGAYMYLFSDQDVLIYETTSFRQIDKWEMSKPVEDGFGRLDFGQTDAYNDEPGSTRSVRRRPSASRWRQDARSPTASIRTSAASSSGSSISPARSSSAAPSSPGARACRSRPARTARCSTSTTPAPPSISTTRRPTNS